MEKLNTLQALNVFEKIMLHGHAAGEGKVLEGVNALAGYDGYTVTLWDEYVSVTIHFHNTCTYDHIDKRHLDAFLDKIAHIDKVYPNRSYGD